MKAIARHISMLAAVAAVALAATGCHSRSGSEPDPGDAEHRVQLNLTLCMPQTSTRAYDDDLDYDTDIQKTIATDDLYVIVYDSEGTILLIPDLEIPEQDITSDYMFVTGTFTATGETVSVRVLANVAEACSSFGSTPAQVHDNLLAYVGKTDADLCEDLLADRFDNRVWPLVDDSGNASRLLPMHSARSMNFSLSDNLYVAISLYRSFAKVGVEYVGADKEVSITALRVYNQMDMGAFYPPTEPNRKTSVQYTEPWIPAAASQLSGYKEYPIFDNHILETVFLPEQENEGLFDSSTSPYLEVLVENTATGYSRWRPLCFTDNSAEDGEPYPIVRNHSYIFRITFINTSDLTFTVDPEWDDTNQLELE